MGKKPYCKKTVKTSSGTFTAYNLNRYECGAERFCKDKGQILAPITTKEDKDAVAKMLSHPNCEGKNMHQSYFLGLQVSMCGGEAHWDFSNGVKWDDETHARFRRGEGAAGRREPMRSRLVRG